MQETSDFLKIKACFYPAPCSLIKPIFSNVMLVMVCLQVEQMESSLDGHLFNRSGNFESEYTTGFSINSM